MSSKPRTPKEEREMEGKIFVIGFVVLVVLYFVGRGFWGKETGYTATFLGVSAVLGVAVALGMTVAVFGRGEDLKSKILQLTVPPVGVKTTSRSVSSPVSGGGEYIQECLRDAYNKPEEPCQYLRPPNDCLTNCQVKYHMKMHPGESLNAVHL